jgi:Pvc16 N-terminal domain
MINEAIEYIRREIRVVLGVDDTEVIAGNVHELKDSNNIRGLYLSLVNLEEESTLKNNNHYLRQNNDVRYQQPAIYLNLFLLFSFNFENYGTSLLRLSQVIELFQSKPVFIAENETVNNPFPSTLEKLIFDFYNLNFEQLNHLWGILGGTYFPSVLYKVRLVKIQRDESIEAPEIITIQVNTTLQ